MAVGSRAALPLAVALAHPEVEAIESGHAYLDALANSFAVCALQTLMAPADNDTWRDFLHSPPPADVIESAFGRVVECFDLAGGDKPFMQVRLDAVAHKKEGKASGTRDDAEEAEGGSGHISLMLPDETSKNQRLAVKSGEHFVKRGRFGPLGPFASGMALLGLNLFGIGGGGGHRFPVTSKAALARLTMPGGLGSTHSLWKSTWLNVQPLSHPSLTGSDSAFTLETVFGWLDPSRRRDRGKGDDKRADATASRGMVRLADDRELPLHPFAFMWGMTRRAELPVPRDGVCTLTGFKGPIWETVDREPGGIQSRLLPRSWHPLIGITTGNKEGERVINTGPQKARFAGAEWSLFFPKSNAGVAGRERVGTPPCLAALASDDRREAIVGLLGRPERKSPSLPLTASAVHHDKVLDRWSEGSCRLWAGQRSVLDDVAGILGSMQIARGDAEEVVKSACSAAARRTSKLRDNTAYLAAWIATVTTDAHRRQEATAEAAIERVADVREDAAPVDGWVEVEESGIWEASMSDCVSAVAEADYGTFGTMSSRSAALTSARGKVEAIRKKRCSSK